MEKKNNLKMILILVSVLVILLVVFYLVTGAISKYTGFSVFNNKEGFEECLKEQDITLFTNSEVPAESLGKVELKNYLKDIKIMNCLRNNQICLDKGIDSFPSWIINNKLIKGDISIAELSESSGCKL